MPIMNRNELCYVLLVGFLTLSIFRILDYYKINEPIVVFSVMIGMIFVVSNIWKNVRI